MRYLFLLLSILVSTLVKAGGGTCVTTSEAKGFAAPMKTSVAFESLVAGVCHDSIGRTTADSTLTLPAQLVRVDSSVVADVEKELAQLTAVKPFAPNPKRALWLAIAFPGAGQIYNRKYWKLPIFYGGFLGCTYALMWNQQMYKDYSKAYLDIMDNDPTTASYKHMLPPRYQVEGMEEQFKTIFKNKKDYFRRYRDLSAFAFVGVYILSIIDAYVDASLSDFDISPDLSLQVQPAAIQQESLGKRQSAYGLGCSLRF